MESRVDPGEEPSVRYLLNGITFGGEDDLFAFFGGVLTTRRPPFGNDGTDIG
jgi:hypothetical protein